MQSLLYVAALLVATAGACGRLNFDAVDDAAATSDAEWIFRVEDRAGFALGDYSAGDTLLAWDGTQVEFAADPPYASSGVGVYISQTFDTGAVGAKWDTLAWIPSAPTAKPLAASGGTDVGYAEGVVDMQDNIVLLHFDDSDLSQGALVLDSSGNNNHGQIVLAGQAVSQSKGRFAGSLDTERDAWVTLPGYYFDFGTGDFTYALWVKMRPCAESNDNMIALGGEDSDSSPHLWLGTSCPDDCPGLDGAHMNFLHHDGDNYNGATLTACTGVALGDGAWHHMASVKRGHSAPDALLQLYIDGREVAATTYDFGTESFTYEGGEIRLGSFNLSEPKYYTSIVVDEAAIWKRALSGAEIASLYSRGALQMGLQVRACADGSCDSEEFVGPDGSNASYFTEADLVGAAGSQQGNIASLGLVGAKAQVRVRFATSLQTASPGLRSLRLEAKRP